MTQNASSIKKEERKWQDHQGGTLQQRAYERAGTRVMMDGQFARVAEMFRHAPAGSWMWGRPFSCVVG